LKRGFHLIILAAIDAWCVSEMMKKEFICCHVTTCFDIEFTYCLPSLLTHQIHQPASHVLAVSDYYFFKKKRGLITHL
jgi:hypothetical protein